MPFMEVFVFLFLIFIARQAIVLWQIRRQIDKNLALNANPVNYLNDSDQEWLDSMLESVELTGRYQPKPAKRPPMKTHSVLAEPQFDALTNTMTVSKEWADNFKAELSMAKHRKAHSAAKIQEFKDKVEARSMVTFYERSLEKSNHKVPHGTLEEIYVMQCELPVATYVGSKDLPVMVESTGQWVRMNRPLSSVDRIIPS